MFATYTRSLPKVSYDPQEGWTLTFSRKEGYVSDVTSKDTVVFPSAYSAQHVAGLGGTLDMVSGDLPRAPKWLREIHMEWLWRLILQPSRVGRIWQSLVIFPLKTFFR